MIESIKIKNLTCNSVISKTYNNIDINIRKLMLMHIVDKVLNIIKIKVKSI